MNLFIRIWNLKTRDIIVFPLQPSQMDYRLVLWAIKAMDAQNILPENPIDWTMGYIAKNIKEIRVYDCNEAAYLDFLNRAVSAAKKKRTLKFKGLSVILHNVGGEYVTITVKNNGTCKRIPNVKGPGIQPLKRGLAKICHILKNKYGVLVCDPYKEDGHYDGRLKLYKKLGFIYSETEEIMRLNLN